ncbi:MAG: CAP domain-containing protein [Acidobacteriaceae bacterium]
MPVPTGNPSVAEQYLFSAVNVERAQRGLQPLHWDGSLYAAASYHAQEMAERQSISHQYQGEPELTARGEMGGAHFSVIAENVAEAPTALMIQQAWMNSPKHRANMLDPRVDSIAIRVLRRDGQLYAVEDFDRTVTQLSLSQQESRVAQVLQSNARMQVLPTDQDARRTCAMDSGYAGHHRPMFIMRYTAIDLNQLPSELERRLSSGQYSSAAVGACPAEDTHNFTAYSIAVLLYP